MTILYIHDFFQVLNQENKESLGVTYSLEADMWSVGVIAYALLR
jgi:hypothetical protein